MWVLVVGVRGRLEHPEGGAATLRQLGCSVRAVDLLDVRGESSWAQPPPAVVLLEAVDEVEAARGAIQRIHETPGLEQVPSILAVSVASAQRVGMESVFSDFVLFPYVPVELYTRIRRLEWSHSEFHGPERLKLGELCLDLAGHSVTVSGRATDLTQQEFSLLAFLAQHRGRVFTREQLLRRVWGARYPMGSRTVDIHIRRIRMKLGTAGMSIETVRGVGYKMRGSP